MTFNFKDFGNYSDSCKHSECAWLLEVLFLLKTRPQTTEMCVCFRKLEKITDVTFFLLNLQNGLTELINYVMFIQFLLHIYIRDKIFSFLSVVQKHSYFLSKMS